jgi:hypothetical protein
MKKASAETRWAASMAVAPQATAECLKSLPPRMSTSAAGYSTSAAATVGLWVITVQARLGGRALASASAVVPPSMMAVPPGRIKLTAAAATCCLPELRLCSVLRNRRWLGKGQRSPVHPRGNTATRCQVNDISITYRDISFSRDIPE